MIQRSKTLIFMFALALMGVAAVPFLIADNGISVTPGSHFEYANEKYRLGNFSEAITAYEKAIAEDPKAGSLYYNLGNAYYRAEDMGDSILAYERGLLYSPRDRDIRHNLSFVRGLLEYKIEDKRSWYLQVGEKVLHRFAEREVAYLFLLSLFLFLLSWNFVLIFKTGLSWGWIRKGLLCLCVLGLVLFAAKSVQTRVVRGAIVMAPEIEVRYGPSDTDQVAFRLGEGLKVYVIDKRESWKRVVLTNGESGWVQANGIAEIQGKDR